MTNTPKRDWRAKSRRHNGNRRFGKRPYDLAANNAPGVPKVVEPIERCAKCQKEMALCVCSAVSPIENEIFTLILRHPQEPDVQLGTAHIATMQLSNSMLKTGLSWPSLTKIMGQEVDPKRWGVLYLGTAQGLAGATNTIKQEPLTVVNKAGEPEQNQHEILEHLQGIILLDGTWSQAKALWWRNAWMLKCRRLVLNPPHASLYGNLRREPRRESVSTIEAAAYTLAILLGDDTLPEKILPPFKLLLSNILAQSRTPKPKQETKKPEVKAAAPVVEVVDEPAPVKKPVAQKAPVKKAAAKKPVTKKPAAKKAPAKKTVVKKPTTKKAAKKR